MSGFEAIFGIVTGGAGLVSLGMQLGDNARKLRKMYQTVKTAPKALDELSDKLETMVMFLHLLDQQQGRQAQPQNLTENIIARCVAECQQRTHEIQQLIDKMQHRMEEHARLRGRLYFAFKDQDVRELSERLDKAASSLTMAFTIKSSRTMEYMLGQCEEYSQRQKHMLALSEHVLDRLPVRAPSADGQDMLVTVSTASKEKKGRSSLLNCIQISSQNNICH